MIIQWNRFTSPPNKFAYRKFVLPPLHAAWRGGCSPGDSREDGGEVSTEMQFVLDPLYLSLCDFI